MRYSKNALNILSVLAALSIGAAQNDTDNRQLRNEEIIIETSSGNGNGNGRVGNRNGNSGGNGNGIGNGFGNGGNGDNPKDGNDDDPVNLIFRYKNQNGKSDVARLGQLGIDISRLGIASVATTRRNWRAILANPNIEYAEPDYEVSVIGFAEESSLRGGGHKHRQLAQTTPYGIDMVKARNVPEIPDWDTKIKVCVVDTGYNLGHPDLPNQNDHNVNGFKPSTYSGSWSIDIGGHGTHVAGIIGAIGTNTIGVDSVLSNPNKFEFFIGKGLNDSGSGSYSAVMNTMEACRRAGAKIINLSLGGGGPLQSFRDLSKDLFDGGILLVAAAGNGGNSDYFYPASYPHLMSVASVDTEGVKSYFSQYNNQVEIAAPGSDVYSTYPTNTYSTLSGTSMASPHVAGVAALVWAHFPECSNLQIRNVLLRSATDKGATGCDVEYGYGIVNAEAAYNLLAAEGCMAGGANPAVLSNGSKGGCGQEVPTGPPPPTPAPTSCPGSIFTVVLLTDNYPGETRYEVKDSDGNTKLIGDNFTQKATTYTAEVCLPNGDYTFTLFDSYGDGVCCGYGRGSYTLLLDGEEIHFGSGDFRFSDSFDFTIGDSTPPGTPNPTPSPTARPTARPTPSPTASPTPSPTSRPTKAPTPPPTNPCGYNETPLRVELRTDNNPGQTSIQIVDSSTNNVIFNENSFTLPNYHYTSVVCVTNGDYIFTINDFGNDGVCCSNGSGNYNIYLDNELIQSGGEFTGSSESTKIVVGDNPCPAGQADFVLHLITDRYPEETRFELLNSGGNVIISGGPFTDAESLVSMTTCLPLGTYTFIIYDSFGDGVCCSYGNGLYLLSVYGASVGLPGGSFTSSESVTFSISEQM